MNKSRSIQWLGVRAIRCVCLLLAAVSLTACIEVYVFDQAPTGGPIQVMIITPTPSQDAVPSFPAVEDRPPETDTWLRPADDMPMIHIAAGAFAMGADLADDQASENEKPAHSVQLSSYWIDEHEVTNAQYQRCVAAGACRPPMQCDWGTPTYGDPARSNHPVICVSWADASAYCQWAGARLPTEAQWEKAARAASRRRYPWGDAPQPASLNLCDQNCALESRLEDVDDGYARTAPAGHYPGGASPYGVLDMAGNVWEWVADWYDPGYYSTSSATEPLGPGSGAQKVSRGGSWDNTWHGVRTTARNWDNPQDRMETVGFRCSMPVVPGLP
ncbi:MAG: formylglycine-generating enzyme family protein [Anaerolineae bacterium]